MARNIHILTFAVLAVSALLSPVSVNAQTLELPEFSVGTFHSLKGFGICADISNHDSAHLNSFALFLDMQSILDGRSSSPGIRARYNYNLPLCSKDLKNGDRFQLYAGPGVTFGYVRDLNSRTGFMCGISGEIVGSFLFENHLSLSVALEASAAFHLREDNNIGVLDFKFFQAGLVNTYMPELRIQYYW